MWIQEELLQLGVNLSGDGPAATEHLPMYVLSKVTAFSEQDVCFDSGSQHTSDFIEYGLDKDQK